MSLIDFCSTGSQRQVVELYEGGRRVREIGRIIGVSHPHISRIVTLVKQRAAAQGYAPQQKAGSPV